MITINNKSLDIFNCKCIKFIPSQSNYKNTNISNVTTSVEDMRSIKTEFIFNGKASNIIKNTSKFIEELNNSVVKNGVFIYKVNISSIGDIEYITNNSSKLTISLNMLDCYEDEESITTTSNTNILINSPKSCYANLELRANTNVISYKVKINDTEITVKNIKGNEVVYIGSGKAIAGGKSKMNDIDMWEFPRLKPGTNSIEVDRADVSLTIKYCERW